jgi:hypothetical protein
MMPKRAPLISTLAIARGVLAYLGVRSPELRSACARYLASLHSTERRREASLQTSPEARRKNARAAIAARWARRPSDQLPYDQAAIMARLAGLESVTVPAAGVRRKAALAALVAAGTIRIVAEGGDRATIAPAAPK